MWLTRTEWRFSFTRTCKKLLDSTATKKKKNLIVHVIRVNSPNRVDCGLYSLCAFICYYHCCSISTLHHVVATSTLEQTIMGNYSIITVNCVHEIVIIPITVVFYYSRVRIFSEISSHKYIYFT